MINHLHSESFFVFNDTYIFEFLIFLFFFFLQVIQVNEIKFLKRYLMKTSVDFLRRYLMNTFANFLKRHLIKNHLFVYKKYLHIFFNLCLLLSHNPLCRVILTFHQNHNHNHKHNLKIKKICLHHLRQKKTHNTTISNKY